MSGAFAAALARTAALSPTKVAAVDDTRRLTYAELAAAVDRAATALVGCGVGPGGVVTSQLPNCVEALVVCLAANRVGAVHNPIVTIYREREVGFIRREAESAVFIDRPDHDVFQSVRLATDDPRARTPSVSEDAPRFLLYTSGSTADPKGVQHTDRTLGAECRAQATYHQLTAHEVFVIPSAVGHISGLLYGILLPIWLGATSVLLGAWDPEQFLAAVEREGGTFSGGAPPFLQGALDHPARDRFDLSSLRIFPCGGADVPPELIRRAGTELQLRTGRGYGSTEFPSITSAAGPGEPEHCRAETDGRPIGENQVRIVDGEIWARGPELFVGYRDGALDADAFGDDGWFRTGDLGTLDDGGYLTVTGRLKDIIVRSGEKISATELESLLAGHPQVADVAVVARPDARTGERACAVVVARTATGPPSLADLCAYLLDLGLSTRKLPEQLELTDALPMTAAGKIDRQTLRQPPVIGPSANS